MSARPSVESDGFTANDAGDRDGGPNGLQNYPELDQAIGFGGGITITGTIDTTPGAAVRLEFFVNDNCDDGENPQAKEFIGSATWPAGQGPTAFKVNLPRSVPQGRGITATATVLGNTSEVSSCLSVAGS